ncbi:MAG: endonuclease [Bacteroidetes bacterium]|nr:MAG: endonuclease [Bacteroidota bacterium]
MKKQLYFYITTNTNMTVLYCGVTNSLWHRLIEHYLGNQKTFAGRFRCYNLNYYEEFDIPMDAIDREKEVKKWSRKKKELLIATMNPDWHFLNLEFFDYWPPPKEDLHSRGE